MEYGISNLSLAPVRAEASDKSEMVTQLLFGEHFEIIGKKNQWRKIRIAYDDYTGWVDEKQFISVPEEVYSRLSGQPLFSTLDLVQIVLSNNTMTPLVMGSNLPFFDGSHCYLGDEKLNYDGHVKELSPDHINKNSIVETAFTYLNSPYLWGGRSPFGIDCSGLTQMVYKLNGIRLKRDASQQAEQGYTLNFLEEAEPGDLVFFDNPEGKIIHVGILIPQGQILHASGKVRIDRLDHHGIFNEATKKYTHKLRLIKRLV
jgi:gamma-D-glutamyl-L-lysine dipeptidyl-peptidase